MLILLKDLHNKFTKRNKEKYFENNLQKIMTCIKNKAFTIKRVNKFEKVEAVT